MNKLCSYTPSKYKNKYQSAKLVVSPCTLGPNPPPNSKLQDHQSTINHPQVKTISPFLSLSLLLSSSISFFLLTIFLGTHMATKCGNNTDPTNFFPLFTKNEFHSHIPFIRMGIQISWFYHFLVVTYVFGKKKRKKKKSIG